MNGGAIRATLIFLLNNTKMPNPTLVVRKNLSPARAAENFESIFVTELDSGGGLPQNEGLALKFLPKLRSKRQLACGTVAISTARSTG